MGRGQLARELFSPPIQGGFTAGPETDEATLMLFSPPIQGGFTATWKECWKRFCCSPRQFRGDSQLAAGAKVAMWLFYPPIQGGFTATWKECWKRFCCSPRQFRGDSQQIRFIRFIINEFRIKESQKRVFKRPLSYYNSPFF